MTRREFYIFIIYLIHVHVLKKFELILDFLAICKSLIAAYY
uniref:Uncharacterized protein n=2 Tax=Amphimedon queenslandica TaxID=400682 RepID=A0A1X7SK01_AMPQE